MSLSEVAVTFECEGDRLIGVVTLPDKPSHVGLGVVIVVGGPQYRVGSHRQFVHLARALAADGYPTFRFDYRGMGDSEGDLRTFESVEPDIQAAVRAFRSACADVQRIVIFGLCDAASAILMAARQVDGLAGMILANPWVRRSETLNAAVVRHYYRERIFSPEFWRKLMTGKLALRSVAAEFLKRVTTFVMKATPDEGSADNDFVDLMRAGWHLPIGKLLLLSGRDITAREFEGVRASDARWSLGEQARLLDEKQLVDADHTFSTAQSRDDAAAHCSRFLAKVSRETVVDSSKKA